MKYLVSLCCALLMLVACSKQPDNNIEANKAAMKRFETMINTADSNIAKELVANDAPFYTPASPTPLYGGEGYLSVVHWMRQSFPDVQWKLEEMVPRVMLSLSVGH